MKGYIAIDQHKIECIIGVYPDERINQQIIYVDLKVEADFSKCMHSDNISDTVNYELLAQLCTDLAKNKQYRLLETFAADALQEIIKHFDVSKAWIRVKKPSAIPTAEFTSVELELASER